jgi:hypothetical protein
MAMEGVGLSLDNEGDPLKRKEEGQGRRGTRRLFKKESESIPLSPLSAGDYSEDW